MTCSTEVMVSVVNRARMVVLPVSRTRISRPGRAGTAFTGPQTKQDRQADWSAAHRQCHDQADDDPPVAAGGHVARLGTVMSPERVVDRLAAPAKQRVVDRHL